MASLTKHALLCPVQPRGAATTAWPHALCWRGVTSCPPFVHCAALRGVVCEWLRMRAARMHQRSGRGACNAADRPLAHALPCCLLAAPAASWGEIGYSTVLRVGPHLEIPTRVPYSASRAAGEPPAPGAKVFTENVRHLGSFIEKRPIVAL